MNFGVEYGKKFPFFFLGAEILFATSAIRPRADVAYCIHALSRRLAKTHNWTVGLNLSIACWIYWSFKICHLSFCCCCCHIKVMDDGTLKFCLQMGWNVVDNVAR